MRLKHQSWAKFHMPRDHEGQGDLVTQASHHMPDEVMNHGGVLILATTIISVQVCFFPSPWCEK